MTVGLNPLHDLFLGDVCREEHLILLQNLRDYLFAFRQFWVDRLYRLVGPIEIRSSELPNKARIQAFNSLNIRILYEIFPRFDLHTTLDPCKVFNRTSLLQSNCLEAYLFPHFCDGQLCLPLSS